MIIIILSLIKTISIIEIIEKMIVVILPAILTCYGWKITNRMRLISMKPDVDKFLKIIYDLRVIHIQKGRFTEKDFLETQPKFSDAYRAINLLLSDKERNKAEKIIGNLSKCGMKFDNCKENLVGESYKKENEEARKLMEEMFQLMSTFEWKIREKYKTLSII